ATSALGILGWNAMHPPQLAPEPGPAPAPAPAPAPQPRPNPEYDRLQADLDQHERRCLQLVKQAVIIISPQNQSQVEQRVKERWNLFGMDGKSVRAFPAKTIQ